MSLILKRLLFHWTASFVLATSAFYLLWVIMPNNYVFGALMRMSAYHVEHTLLFISIPCFFYGIIATLVTERFSKLKIIGRILLTVIVLTVLMISPFGGMLWYYYDMKAGFFPEDWVEKVIRLGFEWGLEIGWLVVAISVTYNIIGSICWCFLMKKGSELFKIDKDELQTFKTEKE